MDIKWKLPKDYMKEVYWVEGFEDAKKIYSGFLFTEYELLGKTRYIVSCNELTSCVVRHIEKYYLDKKEAYTSLVEK